MEEFDEPLNTDISGIESEEIQVESDETSLVEDSEGAELVKESFEVLIVPFNTEENPVTGDAFISQYAILWIPILGFLLMHVIMRIPTMKEKWKP